MPVSRTLHRSLLLGLVLAGLTPVWVRPEVDAATGLPLGVAPGTVRRALADHPDARAVFVGDPWYVGTVGDVAGLADAAHDHGVPLVVDAAWAAHFGFHPELTRHPLELGADVMVTSAHKTLPAWSQAALVLARTERIDAARLDAGVEATATTSPAGAILASTDAARTLLERDGADLLGQAIAATRDARDRLRALDGLVVLDGPAVDPLKLTLVLSGTGADGNAVEQDLLAAGPRRVRRPRRPRRRWSRSPTSRRPSVAREAIAGSVERHRAEPRPVVCPAGYRVEPVAAVPPATGSSPRRRRSRSTGPSAGSAPGSSRRTRRASRSSLPVSSSPPARSTRSSTLGAGGVRIAYAADPTLATLRVTAD